MILFGTFKTQTLNLIIYNLDKKHVLRSDVLFMNTSHKSKLKVAWRIVFHGVDLFCKVKTSPQ